ncbi:hypothetical protein GCM10011512_09800 [Tersicoccus solisilvae]|uniref:Uncharacterized protein n=1 Tax=Tersicoccus solisilvae TaxID=1882339 RepID=A0ABQ1NTK5_9MICC|nr:hypothetical protein [Tersicoccus solisilvae]GGC84977.1 hypothetical protein GCM10011512_09800 [Tersicoccus solisilvae]
MTGERSEDDWVKVLIGAIETGVPVDPGGENLGILDGEFDEDRAVIAPTDELLKGWGSERTVPAAAVRRAVLSRELTADPHGLQIYAVRIVGSLDLTGARLGHRLVFARCHFPQGIRGRQLQAAGLNIPGCRTAEIDLDGAHLDNDAFWAGLTAAGQVRAVCAHIGGQLNLKKATLFNPDGIALGLDGARVDGVRTSAAS